MKKLTSLAVLALATAAGPSFAADLSPIIKAPVVAPAPLWDWTGFYVGIHGGYGWGNADYRFNEGLIGRTNFFNVLPGDEARQRIEGGIVGAHLGYNMQFGSVVVGIEASGSGTWIGSTITSPFFPATDVWTHNVDWIVALTPRLGFTAGSALFYVKGGGAVAEIRNRLQDNLTFGVPVFVESRGTSPGFTVGGGAEYAFTPNWLFGIEGNYYQFNRLHVLEQLRFAGTGVIIPGLGSNHEVETNILTITGRISYKFGAPAPVMARY
jgi:outer membrane immunogenic protein